MLKEVRKVRWKGSVAVKLQQSVFMCDQFNTPAESSTTVARLWFPDVRLKECPASGRDFPSRGIFQL